MNKSDDHMHVEPALMGDDDVSLVELLDRVLHTGVVVAGDVMISVADVDLIYLRLQLLLSSVDTAQTMGCYSSRNGMQNSTKER